MSDNKQKQPEEIYIPVSVEDELPPIEHHLSHYPYSELVVGLLGGAVYVGFFDVDSKEFYMVEETDDPYQYSTVLRGVTHWLKKVKKFIPAPTKIPDFPDEIYVRLDADEESFVEQLVRENDLREDQYYYTSGAGWLKKIDLTDDKHPTYRKPTTIRAIIGGTIGLSMTDGILRKEQVKAVAEEIMELLEGLTLNELWDIRYEAEERRKSP